jgi:putative iron-dependent peroxidase
VFSAASLWRSASGALATALDEAVSDLLAERDRNPHVHIVAARRLAYEGAPVVPWRGPGGVFPSTQTEVFVQVAAETREEMLWGLRRADAIFRGLLECDEELVGGRIGIGRVPFGFRDGLAPPSPDEVRRVAEIHEGPLAGGCWVLYLRFQLDLERFGRLRYHQQERVFGITREVVPIPDVPPSAHVPLTLTYRPGGRDIFIRRGFSFRQEHEEGLAFVAIASDPDAFRRALDVMLGGRGPADALLPYAEAVGGGVYFAPPDAGWLRNRQEGGA